MAWPLGSCNPCSYYRKEGHWERDCSLHPGKPGQNKSTQPAPLVTSLFLAIFLNQAVKYIINLGQVQQAISRYDNKT